MNPGMFYPLRLPTFPDKNKTRTIKQAARNGGLREHRPNFLKEAVSVRWSTSFEDPIPLPDGRQLLTLRDAANHIMKLPKAEHSAPEWQAAMEALILVAETGGPTMLARIGVMRALNRHVVREFTDRKDHHWGQAQAEERPMTVFVYVNTSKRVGDAEHIKVFATTDAAEKWFEENDPEGVAFEYEVLE
jgi:hypothetical protein